MGCFNIFLQMDEKNLLYCIFCSYILNDFKLASSMDYEVFHKNALVKLDVNLMHFVFA